MTHESRRPRIGHREIEVFRCKRSRLEILAKHLSGRNQAHEARFEKEPLQQKLQVRQRHDQICREKDDDEQNQLADGKDSGSDICRQQYG